MSPANNWGVPPWRIQFKAKRTPLPKSADVAIIGGGFTGLAVAACLRDLSPATRVVVLEAKSIGAGASGRTGGMALAESAAGNLPGLGDVLGGFQQILQDLKIDCDFRSASAWEIGRRDIRSDSPIRWQDSGTLSVVNEVPGGTVDAGKLLAGLAAAAQSRGATIHEHCPVRAIRYGRPATLSLDGGELLADRVVIAANGLADYLTGAPVAGRLKLTLAVATQPLDEESLSSVGLAGRNPFYTIDLPYLWGRALRNDSIIFGGGLVEGDDAESLGRIDLMTGRAAELIANIERRVRGLHPALAAIQFTHRWGGPILFGRDWQPRLSTLPDHPNVLILEGYSGQGVTLSVYLGKWAAEFLIGKRALPDWARKAGKG